MTIQNWLLTATEQLKSADIATARLDCLVLLEDETGHDRSWLLAYPEHVLQIEILQKLNTKIVQRAQHTPLAYLRGKAEFYGRTFQVNEHTLVPRPETEIIIDMLRALDLPAQPTILDVGTGTGCIAITATLELPNAHASACDIDPACIQIAQTNAQSLDATVDYVVSDLLANVADHYDVITTNLPYVPIDYAINKAASHEPTLALFSGTDGLDLYRTFFNTVGALGPKYILTESLPEQHMAVTELAKTAGFHMQKIDGFIQLFSRV
jgi:release factor glutamine methyltransferase